MNIQKSYDNNSKTLYLVPTPIGNYEDMTFRAINILKSVDYIYCEDTRITSRLLNHFNIETPLLNYHIFNEDTVSCNIIDKLRDGYNVALVSDAGLPVISDPGFLVSRKAIEEGYNVIGLPGANAALTVLISSGLPAEKFMFIGFLDHKKSQKEKELKSLVDITQTLIFYEAPHRVVETLHSMYDILGDRAICIGREISKRYEEYQRGHLKEFVEQNVELKGEIVIIVEGAKATSLQNKLNSLSIIDHYNYYLNKSNDSKEAMKMVAKDRNISKSEVYKEIMKA